MQRAWIRTNMKTYEDDTELWVSLSGVTFHTPLSLLPVCLHALPAESYGGGTMVSPAFPLSCWEHPFVSCIPFPIHLFLSLPSWKKNSCYFFFFFIQGGGSWACVSKIWVKSVPFDTASPLLFPLCFTWLVKQQSFKKGRRKRRCILSLPLAVPSVCTSGELRLIFNDW